MKSSAAEDKALQAGMCVCSGVQSTRSKLQAVMGSFLRWDGSARERMG